LERILLVGLLELIWIVSGNELRQAERLLRVGRWTWTVRNGREQSNAGPDRRVPAVSSNGPSKWYQLSAQRDS
jgi:hypothetical protein